GIHQDGVLKNRETYEIMKAEDVGWSENRMILGKHSGRSAFKDRMTKLGFEFQSVQALNDAFAQFKNLADKKHDIFDEDLQALISQVHSTADKERIVLISLRAQAETGETPRAHVILNIDNREVYSQANGCGMVDASLKAIEDIVKTEATLALYSVNSISSGMDAQGEVTIRLEKGGRIVNGLGADVDIVIASAKAYIQAANRLDTPIKKSYSQGIV
ncbi:MAG: 2-isopropylmalate synthase, partial [Methylococcales bacterium]|nr:2-isopropylmalate synthase [Methylococcales bacterium]